MRATFAILILCCASIALADDFKTVDGKEYKNVKVSRVEPDGIVITFSGGIVKIPFTELPPEIQQKYGYDPAAAADFQKQAYEAGLTRAREIAEQTKATDASAEELRRNAEWTAYRNREAVKKAEKQLLQIRIFATIEPFNFGDQETVAWIQPYEQYNTGRLQPPATRSVHWVPVYAWRQVGDRFIGVIDEPMSDLYEEGNTAWVTLYKIGHTNDSSRHPLFTTKVEKAVQLLTTGSTSP